jgi:predicted DNA-binding transcriptional regulator YafY
MSKAKLLFDLIMYVNTKRSFTAQEVAYEFNISIRTAHRYLMELDEMGVPLYTEPGRNGGYRLLNNRMLPPVIFNENEAFAIFFAFQSLKYYQTLPFDIDIKSITRKLYATIPKDSKQKIDRLDSVLLFWNKKRNAPFPLLKEIIDASIEKQVLKMEYLSKSNNTVREVAPIGVYAYDGFWYMPAHDLERGEIRLFRSDRIVSVANTHRNFNPQTTLAEWIDHPLTPESSEQIHLYVELNRDGIRQCKSQPWLEPYIHILHKDGGYIDTEIDQSELEYVTKYFFQLGISAKIIEPQAAIDMIRTLSQELIRHYSE